jgi:hypothetical protein
MQMLMLAFRSSLQERVHDLLRQCGVEAFTEVEETIGYGLTGPAEGLSFYPGTNSVILVALDQEKFTCVAHALRAWYQENAEHPGWQKPSIRAFSWPCTEIE